MISSRSSNKDEEDTIKLYQNHSCNPNVGLHGEITFVAMRDITKGEELTVDYVKPLVSGHVL